MKEDLQKQKVRVVIKSWKNVPCEPCEKVEREIEEIKRKYGDRLDISVTEIKIDTNDKTAMAEADLYFGDDMFSKMSAPVVVVESNCKSRKITGYTEGRIEEAIKDVRCDSK